MPLAAPADTCQQEETLCHQCPCRLFFLSQGAHIWRSSWWRRKFYSVCHLGTRGLWASSTTSLNLSLFIKWVQVYFLGVGVYFVCLCTCLCKGRKTWRTESVLRVFLNLVPLYYFWDRISHCSWKSLTDLLVSEFQTASFLCPPSTQGLLVNATRPAFHIRAGDQNLGPQVLQGLSHLPSPQIILLI